MVLLMRTDRLVVTIVPFYYVWAKVSQDITPKNKNPIHSLQTKHSRHPSERTGIQKLPTGCSAARTKQTEETMT
jgi:hypothetical protein